MNSRITGLRVAGTLFAVFCLAHVWRLVSKADVVIGTHHLSRSLSLNAIVSAGGLSLWMWQLSGPES